MTTKCTGAEFKRFMNDPAYWRDGDSGANTWYDDAVILVDGVEVDDVNTDTLADNAMLSVYGGMVLGPVVGGPEPSFEAYLRRWKKAQATTSVVVEVPREKLDALMAAINAAGGRVL